MTCKTLYLIRHTRPMIAAGICYGQLDVEVESSFFEEAAATSRWLPAPKIIISSPLTRTRRLASHLAQTHRCELIQEARLMEMNFGNWEGRDWKDIPRSEIDAWTADTLQYTPPCGESAQQMMVRIQSFLEEVKRMPQQHIALVAHAGSIRAILAQMANIPLTHTLSWQIDYGTVISAQLRC